jgi:microcystin-dependent protein
MLGSPDSFVGEIKLVPYNFAPTGFALCNGQLLPIAQNTALFSLLGTMYGGNGISTFALPDLRGRVAISAGQGQGLSPRDQGEVGGSESVTLLPQEMPAHNHLVNVSATPGTAIVAAGNHLNGSTYGPAYSPNSDAAMPASTIGNTGGGQPHENRQPYLTMNYIIALQGIFPQRP